MQAGYEMGNDEHMNMNDDCCSSILPISSSSTDQNWHLLQQQRQAYHHTYGQVHLLRNNHQQHQEEKVASLLDGNQYRICQQGPPHSVDLPHWQPQQDYRPWRAFKTGSSCSDGNEKWIASGSENKNRPLSELEAVYRLALLKETGPVSVLAAENSHTNGSFPLIPFIDPNVSATATTVADHVSEVSVGEEASMMRARKRMRKKKMEEDVNSIAVFFESLVKRVVSHQEGLLNKFIEVIERMDKEQEEREEAWRRQETENYNREAIVRARERAMACSRDSSILSCIERITGQSLNLGSRKTPQPRDQGLKKSLLGQSLISNARKGRRDFGRSP